MLFLLLDASFSELEINPGNKKYPLYVGWKYHQLMMHFGATHPHKNITWIFLFMFSYLLKHYDYVRTESISIGFKAYLDLQINTKITRTWREKFVK